MAFSVNDNGTWKTVKKLSVNDGTWKTVKSGWINKNGVWTKFYASDVTVQVTVVGGGGGAGNTIYVGANYLPSVAGGNGGGGGASMRTLTIPQGETVSIAVGAAGVQGAGGTQPSSQGVRYAANGSAGTNSSASSTSNNMIGYGGAGGQGGGYLTGCTRNGSFSQGNRCPAGGAPGAGGTASGGSTNTSGSSNGTSGYPPYGNAGASGVVIIKVPSTTSAATTTGTVSVTTVGSETVYTFTSSGTITFN